MRYQMVIYFAAMSCAFRASGEDLYATSNYWGSTREQYRERVFDAASVLATNGQRSVIGDWYCDLAQLPNLDREMTSATWLEEKTLLMYYLATTQPVRSSTNCWFAAADTLGVCRALRSQCERSLTQREPITTNMTPADVQQIVDRRRDRKNLLIALNRAEMLIAFAVTNKFPNSVGKVLPAETMGEVQRQAYSRAGL